jgi:hypothetical protein
MQRRAFITLLGSAATSSKFSFVRLTFIAMMQAANLWEGNIVMAASMAG